MAGIVSLQAWDTSGISLDGSAISMDRPRIQLDGLEVS